MGNTHHYGSSKYRSGISKSSRLSWSNSDGEPRVFTPWDTVTSPGVSLEEGQYIPDKAVRFLLGDPALIPESRRSSDRSLSPENSVKSILKKTLQNPLEELPADNQNVQKRKSHRRSRKVRSVNRTISNNRIDIIPHYFTRKGVPKPERLPKVPEIQSPKYVQGKPSTVGGALLESLSSESLVGGISLPE